MPCTERGDPNDRQTMSTTNARVFDRIPQYDERSRAFPIRTLVEDKTPRSYTWGIPGFAQEASAAQIVGALHKKSVGSVCSPVAFDQFLDGRQFARAAALTEEIAAEVKDANE